VVAVLAAISDEIKSRGGTESDTEYFAALVSYVAAILSLLLCFPSMCVWLYRLMDGVFFKNNFGAAFMFFV